MTPQIIDARLLKARQDELRRIVQELHQDPPHNAAELIDVCREAQDAIAIETRRLQDDRLAISRR